MNRVVTDLLPMFRSLLGETIDLTVLSRDAPTLVRADQGQLEQVIINLVVNARDAMTQGGRLIVRTSAIDVDAHPDLPSGPYVLLAVD